MFGCGGLDQVKGVKGTQGDSGTVGPMGPQGPAGPQGQQGATGKDGQNGSGCKVTDTGDAIEISCGDGSKAVIEKSSNTLVICACWYNRKTTITATIDDINAGKYKVLSVGPCQRGSIAHSLGR